MITKKEAEKLILYCLEELRLLTEKPYENDALTERLSTIKPRFCSRCRSEAPQTEAKRAVGAILRRRHNHYYVKEQNRETSVAARICKP